MSLAEIASTAGGPRDETARLNYLVWKDDFRTEKPYEILSAIPKGFPKTNFVVKPGPHDEIMHDIRGRDTEFTLDANGFEIRQHALDLAPETFDNAETIEREYLPMVEALLQEVDPGAEVYIFDWRMRSSDRSKSKLSVPGAVVDLDDPLIYLHPVHAVHVDQSRSGAVKRVRHHMGQRADALLKGRFRIINIWRPFNHPIETEPLAVCDGSTVPASKLIAADHVRKYYVGESLYPLPDPQYRWYYLSRQTKDECLVFKTFDSSGEVTAKCCPHTAFPHENVPADVPPRETIEVRALVFSPQS
ncbi:hypothetical protein QBC47DRAFT_124929 [Echria macrotheca]|uniref:Methyltransferase n=1 Tax=Echria macrotheca TaxID=438768 RepID=A0AAJ0B1Z8_9PEZI|nr:hypothetical protein QBC47DRAFT_124929 [Echria macrotheca]